MENILNEFVSVEDLQNAEANLKLAVEDELYDRKFEYALCLVRSRHTGDVERGLEFFKELSKDPLFSRARRECLYYLAYGNARLKNFDEALKYCETFLMIETNDQIICLMKYVKKEMNDRKMITAAVAFAGVGIAGAILGAYLKTIPKS